MKWTPKKERGFCDEGRIFENEVVGRKINGLLIETDSVDDPIWFLPYDSIEIIQISEQEKNIPIVW